MVLWWWSSGHHILVYKIYAGTRETLEFAGTLINFHFGKFGYSICPLFSKGHAEIFREFWHDFAKNRIYDLLNLCTYPVRPLS